MCFNQTSKILYTDLNAHVRIWDCIRGIFPRFRFNNCQVRDFTISRIPFFSASFVTLSFHCIVISETLIPPPSIPPSVDVVWEASSLPQSQEQLKQRLNYLKKASKSWIFSFLLAFPANNSNNFDFILLVTSCKSFHLLLIRIRFDLVVVISS